MDTRETVRSSNQPTGRSNGRGRAEPTAAGARKPGAFSRLGGFVVRRRRWIVAAWAIVLIAMVPFAKGLQGRLGQGGWDVPGSDSLAVQDQLETRFAQQPAAAYVVVHSDGDTVAGPAFRSEIAALSSRIGATAHVRGVQWANSPAFVSPDGHTTFLVVGLQGDQNQNLETARAVSTAAAADVPAGFRVETGGSSAFYNRFNDISRTDLETAEKVSFPVTLLVLVIAFTTLVAAGMPILLALVSLVVTLGGLYFVAGVTDMSVYVTNTASVIGIGVGIDYALFVVTRFREELRRGRSVADAIPITLATSGRAVALSGATVIVALFGMFLVDIQAFRSMAIGSMSVVAIAVIGAVTLIPAILAMLGHRVNRWGVPLLGRQRPEGTGFWHRWALSVMRRPWTYLIISLAVLLTLALPLLSMRMGQSGPQTLPPGDGPRVASEMLAGGFGAGVTGPIEITVSTAGATAAQTRADVARLVSALRADPAVASVGAPVTSATPGPGLVWLTVVGHDSPESRGAETFVTHLRTDVIPSAGLGGRALVGGETAFNLDLEHAIAGTLPYVVLTVLALSFLLLAMAFRSLLLPLKAILMNLLSVGAAYGLMTAIFQWGWGQSILGFTSEGHISAFVPMFLFCILFGLSMDYEVFLMTRIREEYQRTGSNELAVAHGLETSARTITSAALIMVTVFAAFASSRLVPFKEMGFGLAAAVFIDATIVRTVLVPSAMKLMGDWNWWMPSWLDRWLPRIALETESEAPAAATPELETV
jgi:RND superfamily putative drug exporter